MIYALVFLHFLSDFVLQRDYVAKNKSSNWVCLLEHMLIIYLTFGLFAWYIDVSQWIPIVYTIMHGFQDVYIWSWFKKSVSRRVGIEDYVKYNLHVNDGKFWNTIAADQTIHLCMLFFLFTLPF